MHHVCHRRGWQDEISRRSCDLDLAQMTLIYKLHLKMYLLAENEHRKTWLSKVTTLHIGKQDKQMRPDVLPSQPHSRVETSYVAVTPPWKTFEAVFPN